VKEERTDEQGDDDYRDISAMSPYERLGRDSGNSRNGSYPPNLSRRMSVFTPRAEHREDPSTPSRDPRHPCCGISSTN
jgi:hypothetical protein